CCYFGGAEKGAKVNLDNLLPDLDFLGDRFDDRPLLLRRQVRPALIEVSGLRKDFVLAEEPDPQEIRLALESRELLFQPLESLLQRPVAAAEALHADLVIDVGPVHPVHLLPDLAELRLKGRESFFLRFDLLVRLPEVLGHILGREEKAAELLVE